MDASSYANNGTASGSFSPDGPAVSSYLGGSSYTFTGAGEISIPPSSTSQMTSGGTFEVWFNTTAADGEVLLGAQSSDPLTGSESSFIPLLFVNNLGELCLGLSENNPLCTSTAVNTGQWVMADLEMSTSAQTIFVDGEPAAQGQSSTALPPQWTWMTSLTWAAGFLYTRADGTGGTYTSTVGVPLTGSVADAAVYPSEVPASDIATRYSLATTGS